MFYNIILIEHLCVNAVLKLLKQSPVKIWKPRWSQILRWRKTLDGETERNRCEVRSVVGLSVQPPVLLMLRLRLVVNHAFGRLGKQSPGRFFFYYSKSFNNDIYLK